VSLTEDLQSARTEAREAADLLVRAAAEEERDLTAEEMSAYQDHLGEEREAAERLESLRDDEVRELRASVARATSHDEQPSMGDMLLRTISEESQFLETQRFNVTQVARVFGVPPEMVGGDAGNSLTYANTEARALDFLRIGRTLSLEEGTIGLSGEWQLSRTSDADEVLSLARDGVPLGLSVGFQPIESKWKGRNVTRVRARLGEVSVVGVPQYAESMVSAVRSSTPRLDAARLLRR
jgi:Phage portal protein/Caudovirus prohead serine protease